MTTWLDDYTKWAMQRSPLTPKHFHENIGLSMVAGAVAGRVTIQLPHERLTPNLWTLIVATTSIYAKSTAFKVARELGHLTMPEKTLSSVSTPEALMSEFSGARPSNFGELSEDKQTAWKDSAQWGARRLLIMDEAGRFFNSLQRDYNATLDALLMEAYDASGENITRQTMKGGLISVERPCLSCLFATTPANVRMLLSSHDQWASGWWIRWNFVTAQEITDWKESEYVSPPTDLVVSLRNLSHVSLEKYNGKEHNAAIDKSVVTAYNEMTRQTRDAIIASDDEKLHGMISRLPTKRLKAALLFAIMESKNGKVHIKACHWDAVDALTRGWERDSQVAIKLSAQSERMSIEEKVFAIIRTNHNANGVTARQIQQKIGKTAQEVDSILSTFVRNATIVAVDSGRTKVFKLASPDAGFLLTERQL